VGCCMHSFFAEGGWAPIQSCFKHATTACGTYCYAFRLRTHWRQDKRTCNKKVTFMRAVCSTARTWRGRCRSSASSRTLRVYGRVPGWLR
jgi:hypothetical protein